MKRTLEFIRHIVKSTLFRSMGFYTLANFLNSAIPFVLLPLLTAYLKTDEYGRLSIIQVLISFIVPFVSISINGSVGVEYFRMEKSDLAKHVSTAVVIPFISALFFFIVLIFLGHTMAEKFSFDYKWLLFLPLFALFQSITQVILALYQARNKPVYYGLFQVGITLLNIALSFVFVITFDLSWEGRLYAILFSSMIFFVLSFFLLWKMGYLTLSFSREHVVSILKFGTPLIPHAVGGSLLAMSDRLLISRLVDIHSVGIYVVACQVGMIMMMIQDSFNRAWAPYLFSKLTNITYEGKLKLVKKSYVIMAGMILCFLFIYSLTPLIFKFFIDKKFYEATQFVFWILLGSSFLGMYKVVTNYIFFQRKTYMLAYLTLGCAVFSISMNYIFITRFGAIGAAYVNAITWFIFFSLTWFLSNKVFPLPWFYFLKKKTA